ncbi:unnamed protein product [Danaus chrysippus]|uniref:(African queen) hypothetical protein n=1 Tax=Danaus chrysippus TaxID=151541 RepID=A0A8J2QZD3_9NEOP|nr:unnamed protein product [Danaus chrysippus]
MSSRWGRKRCARLCSPPPFAPRPRACLDSLEIPFQTPLVLRHLPPSKVPPCYIRPPQPQCARGIVCHCADQNYCTAETCRSPSRCCQSDNLYCLYGNKENDEDSVCQRRCRYQEGDEDSSAKDSEDDRSSTRSNHEYGLDKDDGSDDNLGDKLSNTSEIPHEAEDNEQNKLSNDTLRDRNGVSLMEATSGIKNVGNTKKNNKQEVHCMTSFNRDMQVSMQTRTFGKRTRDASNTASPEVRYGGNNVQSAGSLTDVTQFDANRQADTSLRQSCCSNSQRNNIEDGYEEDDDDDERLNDETLNSCCRPGYGYPQSNPPLPQADFTCPQSRAFNDDFNESDADEYFSKPSGNSNTKNPKTSTPLRINDPESNVESLCIKDSLDILQQENKQHRNPSANIMDHSNFNQNYLYSQDKSNISKREPSPKNQTEESGFCVKGVGWKCPALSELKSSSLNHVPSRGSQSPNKNVPRRYSSSQISQVRFDRNVTENFDDSPIEKQNSNSRRISPKSQSYKKYPTQYTGYIPRKSSALSSLPCEGCSHGPRPKPKIDISCVCSDEKQKITKADCTRTPSCNFKDGTTSCASISCVVNANSGCGCCYPPSFSYLSCSGNISGTCNCRDKR